MVGKAGPISDKDRIVELDVLRGFALLGVLVGIHSEYLMWGMAATTTQLASLPTANADSITSQAIQILVTGKASAMFACLFGIGFYLQLGRLKARRDDYKIIYSRRLLLLFLYGSFQLVFFFPKDIVHLYALVGMIMFALRSVDNRTLVSVGLILAVFGSPVMFELFAVTGVSDVPGLDEFYSDEGILARQALLEPWSYQPVFEFFLSSYLWKEWVLSGAILSIGLYTLGRFMIGTYMARQGWFLRPQDFIEGFRKWLWPLLLAGLTIEVFTSMDVDSALPEVAFFGLDNFGNIVLAGGYSCAIVLGLRSKASGRFLRVLAPVGKMALTNYSLLGLASTWLVYGPGGTAGRVGVTFMVSMGCLFFLAAIILSNIWLRYFRYGPLEWGWRALTYLERPQFRR